MNTPASPAPILPEEKLQQARQLLEALRGELAKAVIGQRAVIDEVLIGLLADAHVLIEGVPGLGKTLLVKALARSFGGQTTRIQFTPDCCAASQRSPRSRRRRSRRRWRR